MNTPRRLHVRFPALIAAAACAALAAPAWAQSDGAQPPSQPTKPPAEAPKPDQPAVQPKDPMPLPSLDDLLGLPSTAKPGKRPAAPDPDKAELERQLSPGEAAEQFRQAVDLMGQTARRLTDSRDTGLRTQRLQEDVVRKLDMLIKSAEQQKQQRRQSSSGSSSRPQQDQQNQPSQQQQSTPQDAANGDNRDERMPPGRRDGPLNPELASRGAAWGALPARVRDALLQGRSDKFSALYQRMTEAYYRKLAEEPK